MKLKKIPLFFLIILILPVLSGYYAPEIKKLDNPVLNELVSSSTIENVYAQSGSRVPSTIAQTPILPVDVYIDQNFYRLNNTMFVYEFYRGSTGYNIIKNRKGQVQVYNERITLQYQQGSNWNDIGTPRDVLLTCVSKNQYDVTRLYDDFAGTKYNVSYTVKSDQAVKVTISLKNGRSEATNFQLAWEPSGIVDAAKGTKLAETSKINAVEFGVPDSFSWIRFDWTDVAKTGMTAQPSYSDQAQGRKASIIINIDVLNPGQTKIIDPSTVGTSTAALATAYGPQRKLFLTATLHWVWYSDGTNLGYRTSSDGAAWGAFQPVRACTTGEKFSVDFNGTHCSYAYTSTAFNTVIYFRMGAPQSDGSITWSAVEQSATTANANYDYWYLNVRFDSNGYPYVAYLGSDDAGANYYPWITKSSKNDGTWTTPAGYPLRLNAGGSASVWWLHILALTAGKLTVVYANAGTTVRSRTYDGATWAAEQPASASSVTGGQYTSAVSVGDDVHVIFTSGTDIHHVMRTYSNSTWSSLYETHLYHVVSATCGPILTLYTGNNTLYCFWAGTPTANHIYYKWWAAGIYHGSNGPSDAHDWIDESAVGLTGNQRLTGFWTNCSGKIGLAYMTAAASPYNVRYAFLTGFNAAPTNVGAAIPNRDDGNNVYAMSKPGAMSGWYFFTSNHTDADGYADVHYVRLRIKQGAATRAEFNYDEDSNTFSIVSGSANWELQTIPVTPMSYASRSGIKVDIAWCIRPKWSATEESNLDLEIYVEDAAAASDTDVAQTHYFDCVTRLVTINFVSSKSYSAPGGSVTMTLDVRYGNDPGSNVASALYPHDAEFSAVKIHDSAHVVVGTDNAILSGAVSVTFNLPAVAGTYTYHVYIDGSDASFTDQDAVDGDTVSVTVTSMSLILTVSAIHGTYESKMNVTALWANGTAVSSTTFNAYSSVLLGSAVSSGSGLAQFTFTGKSLQGSGTLVFNGTKNGVTGSASVSYSIVASGAVYGYVPSSWNMGQAQSLTLSFTNGADVNGTKIKLENVRVCFRLLSGSTVLFQGNSSSFDVDANTLKTLSQSLSLTGVGTTGDYTLRALILQLGSEATLGTLDRTVRVQALGSESGIFSQSPRLVIPLIQPIVLKQGDSRTFKFTVQLSQVSVADFLAGSCSGVPTGWVTVNAPSRISLSSPAEIEVVVNVPSDAFAETYELIIPFTASASSGSSRQSASFTLTVEAKTVSVPSFSIFSAVFEASSIMVVVFVVIGFMLLAAVVLVLTGDKKPKRSKYYHK